MGGVEEGGAELLGQRFLAGPNCGSPQTLRRGLPTVGLSLFKCVAEDERTPRP